MSDGPNFNFLLNKTDFKSLFIATGSKVISSTIEPGTISNTSRLKDILNKTGSKKRSHFTSSLMLLIITFVFYNIILLARSKEQKSFKLQKCYFYVTRQQISMLFNMSTTNW